MIEYMPYVWTLVLILSVLMEAATVALTSVWFMPAAFVCLIMSIFDVNIVVQVVTYFVLSAVALVLTKVIFRSKFSQLAKTPTNADRVIGKTAVVTVDIDNDAPSGEVTVAGQVWTARSETGEKIAAGTKVTALRIEGVKLIVGTDEMIHDD